MLRYFERAFNWVTVALASLAAAAVLVMVIIVTVNVFLRATGAGSITWTDEISEYLLYGLTLFSAPWLLHRGGHIAIDIVFQFVSSPVAAVIKLVSSVICLAICLVTAWYGARAMLASYEAGMVTIKSLVFSEWWIILPFPVIFGLLSVEFGRKIVTWRQQ